MLPVNPVVDGGKGVVVANVYAARVRAHATILSDGREHVNDSKTLASMRKATRTFRSHGIGAATPKNRQHIIVATEC